MSFRADMWDQRTFLKDHQKTNSKRLKGILGMMRQRVSIETAYSRQMDKLQREMKGSLSVHEYIL